jgi:hypothetical protein
MPLLLSVTKQEGTNSSFNTNAEIRGRAACGEAVCASAFFFTLHPDLDFNILSQIEPYGTQTAVYGWIEYVQCHKIETS